MAKTIKFNLTCDGESIRTIEDLREHFSVEDILEHYKSGLLLKWLEVRRFKEYAEVKELKETDSIKIIEKLSSIFKVDFDQDKVKEILVLLAYFDSRAELLTSVDNGGIRVNDAIYNLLNAYTNLIGLLTSSSSDISVIKAHVQILIEYEWIFKYDYRRVFNLLREKNPKSIYYMLMNPTLRKYYLPEFIKKADNGWEEKYIHSDTEEIYINLRELVDKQRVDSTYVKSYNQSTENSWNVIAPQEKQVMILKIGDYDHIRPAGTNCDLKNSDVNYQFVIMNGLEYKDCYPFRKPHNAYYANNSDLLIYMEV